MWFFGSPKGFEFKSSELDSEFILSPEFEIEHSKTTRNYFDTFQVLMLSNNGLNECYIASLLQNYLYHRKLIDDWMKILEQFTFTQLTMELKETKRTFLPIIHIIS